jgi:endonuclease VIII
VPEGDNIRWVARQLEAELPGRILDRIELKDRGPIPELAGRRVEKVDAIGKHMFVHLEGGWTLRIHLGMHGRWSRFHARERHPVHPTLVLVSGNTAWVCFRAYRAEAIRTDALRAHPKLARLGPDLLDEPAPIAEAVARARIAAYAGREIGDLVMDQRVAAGIGNIYKSETLFECRVHPRTLVRELSDERLTAIYAKAAELMRLWLLIPRRGFVPLRRREKPTARRFWVYRRKGKPCLDCGTPIERFLQGDMGRSTYFCPSCQAAVDSSAAASE